MHPTPAADPASIAMYPVVLPILSRGFFSEVTLKADLVPGTRFEGGIWEPTSWVSVDVHPQKESKRSEHVKRTIGKVYTNQHQCRPAADKYSKKTPIIDCNTLTSLSPNHPKDFWSTENFHYSPASNRSCPRSHHALVLAVLIRLQVIYHTLANDFVFIKDLRGCIFQSIPDNSRCTSCSVTVLYVHLSPLGPGMPQKLSANRLSYSCSKSQFWPVSRKDIYPQPISWNHKAFRWSEKNAS